MLEFMNSLLGRQASFYPFEAEILKSVIAKFDARTAEKLQNQLDVVNKVQRLADGKEVNLYQMRKGKPEFDDSLRFPIAADEALLASVALNTPANKRAKLKVQVWLAKGRLFSLTFNKPPIQFFSGQSLKTVQVEISDLKIWFDPMLPYSTEMRNTVDIPKLEGWLLEWHRNGIVADLKPPLPLSERSSYLARVDAQLPQDYLEFVTQTEGAKLMNCTVYGIEAMRQIVWVEASYYILAEVEGLGALAVKEDDRNIEIYLLSYENNVIRLMGGSFQRAVAELLQLG